MAACTVINRGESIEIILSHWQRWISGPTCAWYICGLIYINKLGVNIDPTVARNRLGFDLTFLRCSTLRNSIHPILIVYRMLLFIPEDVNRWKQLMYRRHTGPDISSWPQWKLDRRWTSLQTHSELFTNMLSPTKSSPSYHHRRPSCLKWDSLTLFSRPFHYER